MQGKLQETFGWSTVERLDSMRQTLERFASLDADHVAVGRLHSESSNPELEARAQKVSEKLSENVHIIANEPSLAFYRIQEHVRKTLPPLIDKKHEVVTLQRSIQGSCFDAEYAISALKEMESSRSHFNNIQELMKNAMFMKQQIQYEQERRQMERSRPSMYRPMMRTQTLDVSAVTPSSERRRTEFTSVQLPAAVSLSEITEDTQRTRSASFSVADNTQQQQQQQQLQQQH